MANPISPSTPRTERFKGFARAISISARTVKTPRTYWVTSPTWPKSIFSFSAASSLVSCKCLASCRKANPDRGASTGQTPIISEGENTNDSAKRCQPATIPAAGPEPGGSSIVRKTFSGTSTSSGATTTVGTGGKKDKVQLIRRSPAISKSGLLRPPRRSPVPPASTITPFRYCGELAMSNFLSCRFLLASRAHPSSRASATFFQDIAFADRDHFVYPFHHVNQV